MFRQKPTQSTFTYGNISPKLSVSLWGAIFRVFSCIFFITWMTLRSTAAKNDREIGALMFLKYSEYSKCWCFSEIQCEQQARIQ